MSNVNTMRSTALAAASRSQRHDGSLTRMVRRLVSYTGEAVVIDWHDETDADWPTFRVLRVDMAKQRVWLKGMDDTEGNKHVGDEFWVPVVDIRRVTERPPNDQAQRPGGEGH